MSLKVRISILAGIATCIGVIITCGRLVYAAGANDREKVTHSELDIRLEKYVTKDQFGEVKEVIDRIDRKMDESLKRSK